VVMRCDACLCVMCEKAGSDLLSSPYRVCFVGLLREAKRCDAASGCRWRIGKPTMATMALLLVSCLVSCPVC
jgi:hypothetical protein